MPNLSEYNEIKKTLVRAIINDRSCVDLITDTTSTTLPAKALIETIASPNQIHLYDYVPGTTTEKKVHVCIEVEGGPATTNTVALFYVTVDVIVPESLMVMSGAIRRDALAAAIDALINRSGDYGFNLVKRLGDSCGIPADGFRGRTMRYSVKGWNKTGVTI